MKAVRLLCRGSAFSARRQSPAPGKSPWSPRPSALCRQRRSPTRRLRPAQLRPGKHSQLYFCFTPQSLQLLYLPLTMTMKYWRKPRKTAEHWKARTGDLFVHQVLGAAPRPYAWGTGKNLPRAKGIPEGFSCVLVECIIPKHKHKNTDCPPIFFYPTWNL